MARPVIFSRRGVHLWTKGAGSYDALFVPSEDQVVMLRDVISNSRDIAIRMRAENRIPLWREKRGQVTVYGFMPPELMDTRQALKVWLAEDYAPKGCSAFFFVVENWVVHAIKEIDDEHRESWRNTVISYPAAKLVEGVATAAADLLLRFTAKEICVAVAGGFESQSRFKSILDPLSIACQPFEALKPNMAPLYQQRNYGVPMFISLVLLATLCGGMLVHVLNSYYRADQMQAKTEAIKRQIQSVQINKHLGYIHEPQPVLDDMRKPFQQQPSAILDAAARFSRALGNLNSIAFSTGMGVDPAASGIMPVQVQFNSVFDKMLVDQERTTRELLPQAPWIREVLAQPGSNGLGLKLALQISTPAGAVVPSATSVFQPVLSPPEGAAPVSPTGAQIPASASLVISGTAALALPPPPVASPTMPVSGSHP